MATIRNIVIEQGASFSLPVVAFDASDNVNISQYGIYGSIKKTYASVSSVLFTITKTDASEGELEAVLSASQTASLKPGRYVYDIILIDQENKVYRLLEGIVTVTPMVTRVSTTTTTTSTSTTTTSTTTTTEAP